MTVAKSGCTIRPCYCAHHFLDTNRYQSDGAEGDRMWIKSCYCDKVEMFDKLSTGMNYKDSYFSEEVGEENFNEVNACRPVK